MRFFIDVTNEDFVVNYIPGILRAYIINNYNLPKAKKLNLYLKELGVKQDVRELLLYAVDTLKVVKERGGFSLMVDKNKTPINSPYNIQTLVKFISEGTVDIRGYPLLNDAIRYVILNLKTLKLIYMAKYEKQNKKRGGRKLNGGKFNR